MLSLGYILFISVPVVTALSFKSEYALPPLFTFTKLCLGSNVPAVTS